MQSVCESQSDLNSDMPMSTGGSCAVHWSMIGSALMRADLLSQPRPLLVEGECEITNYLQFFVAPVCFLIRKRQFFFIFVDDLDDLKPFIQEASSVP